MPSKERETGKPPLSPCLGLPHEKRLVLEVNVLFHYFVIEVNDKPPTAMWKAPLKYYPMKCYSAL